MAVSFSLSDARSWPGEGHVWSGDCTSCSNLRCFRVGHHSTRGIGNTLKEKNGKLYTRILLATADCAEGYSSVASQVVQAFAPIETEEFGDGRSAILAQEAKFRVDGVFRMQELHDEFGTLEVTAADNFDPARVIQESRRIYIELDSLGNKVVPARKTHAFFLKCCAKGRVVVV